MRWLQRQRDKRNGSSVVLEYSLSKKAVGLCGALLGAGLATGAILTQQYVEHQKSRPVAGAPTVVSLGKALADTKSSLGLELDKQRQATARAKECTAAIDLKRQQEITELKTQIAAFPPFKTEAYRQPFDKLKATLEGLSQAQMQVFGTGNSEKGSLQDCLSEAIPRG